MNNGSMRSDCNDTITCLSTYSFPTLLQKFIISSTTLRCYRLWTIISTNKCSRCYSWRVYTMFDVGNFLFSLVALEYMQHWVHTDNLSNFSIWKTISLQLQNFLRQSYAKKENRGKYGPCNIILLNTVLTKIYFVNIYQRIITFFFKNKFSIVNSNR